MTKISPIKSKELTHLDVLELKPEDYIFCYSQGVLRFIECLSEEPLEIKAFSLELNEDISMEILEKLWYLTSFDPELQVPLEFKSTPILRERLSELSGLKVKKTRTKKERHKEKTDLQVERMMANFTKNFEASLQNHEGEEKK